MFLTKKMFYFNTDGYIYIYIYISNYFSVLNVLLLPHKPSNNS